MKTLNLSVLALSLLTSLASAGVKSSDVKYFYTCGDIALDVMKDTSIATSGDNLEGLYTVQSTPSQLAGLTSYSGTKGGTISTFTTSSQMQVQDAILSGNSSGKVIIDGNSMSCTLLTPAQPAVSAGNVETN